MILALTLVFQTMAATTQAIPPTTAERLTMLESDLKHLTQTCNRIETKVDKLEAFHSKGGGDAEPHDMFAEHWLEALLALVIALDKGGYYIKRRKNGESTA